MSAVERQVGLGGVCYLSSVLQFDRERVEAGTAFDSLSLHCVVLRFRWSLGFRETVALPLVFPSLLTPLSSHLPSHSSPPFLNYTLLVPLS